MANQYDHFKTVPETSEEPGKKKKKTKVNGRGWWRQLHWCQVCVPFCPVDCIEPVNYEKYEIPIPPVQVRFNECIGCQICAKVCTKLTWDAIRMIPTKEFEDEYGIDVG